MLAIPDEHNVCVKPVKVIVKEQVFVNERLLFPPQNLSLGINLFTVVIHAGSWPLWYQCQNRVNWATDPLGPEMCLPGKSEPGTFSPSGDFGTVYELRFVSV